MSPGRIAPLLFVAGVVAAGCTEKLPRAFEGRGAASPTGKPIGLDSRPVSTTCIAKAKPAAVSSNGLIGLQRIPAKLEKPVEILARGGAFHVLEQSGRVMRVAYDGTSSVTADLRSKLIAGGEAGLLGIAFHPQFATNGFVFLYYTVPHPVQPAPAGVAFQSALVRYKSNDGGLTLDLASEKRIATVDQPFSNHNGGTIAFGSDGFLYWGLGDGGSGGDPQGNAQKTTTLLGKMLRIDIDGGDPYAIPGTNPFASGTAGRPEIYALGLRNPYRFRFDAVTGDLWAGDVGQGAREEIDKIVLGGNYGWNVREGKICFAQASCSNPFLDPVVDHPRTEAVSITGGVVYRGTGVPLLTGKYIYGDFGLGSLFAIPIDEPAPTALRLDEGLERTNPGAFAIDKDGEVVFVDYSSGDIVRIVAGGATGPAEPEMPELLTKTGCVRESDPTQPVPGLFPYDVNVAQWVDGASAERWLSVPAGSAIVSDPEGHLGLPPGSVAMKTLSAEGRRVETQLLLKRPDASWSAYAYIWNAEQTNATLATKATTLTLPSGRKHTVVDRSECISCHAVDVLPTIGLEAAQLDRDDVDFGGGRLGNPLATLEKLGMLATPIPRDIYSPLPPIRGFQPTEQRARGYLHANCAHCHHGGEKLIDLRFRTSSTETRACASDLLRAMQPTAEGRMPPLGSSLPDDEGIRLVASWAESLARCP